MKLKKMNVDRGDGKDLVFSTKDRISPAVCTASNIDFTDRGLSVNLLWHSRGHYSNLQRKKMIKKTILALLRRLIHSRQHNTQP